MRSILYNHACLFVLVAILFSAVACTREHPRHSAIVDKVQLAGAGDVAAASPFSVEDWMRKHRDVAVEVDKMCAPAREKGDPQWGDTTEGKVCVAARNAAMSTYRSPRDGKTYQAGDK
jgi:hypothetical protein